MPYRIDLVRAPAGAADLLIDLGALDLEVSGTSLAALLPDAIEPASVERALAPATVTVSAATGRDDGSVWTLRPRPVRVGSLVFIPADAPAGEAGIRLADGPAFGTGLHPTTVLCLEAIDAACAEAPPARMLDVGTGSGILALAAVRLGVPQVTGVEIDPAAVEVARGNARLNGWEDRITIRPGGPDAAEGMWPLVVANIRAGELIELAPALARRTASRGRLVLSGIPRSAADQVEQAYRRTGMSAAVVTERDGWVALDCQPSW